MIAVIFEVEPADGQKDEYLDIAAELKSMLDEVEGFISVERFQSLTDPSKILSRSVEDEPVLVRRPQDLDLVTLERRRRLGPGDVFFMRVVSLYHSGGGG